MVKLNVVHDRGRPHGSDSGILAEFASLQLEYTYLAKLTGNPSYLNRVSFNIPYCNKN